MYRWNRTIKKAAAWALAAVLAGTYADVGAFSAIPAYAATEETAEKETILSFAALPEEIQRHIAYKYYRGLMPWRRDMA